MFDSNSRYYDPKILDATYTLPDGRKVAYRPLRTVPQLDDIVIQSEVESAINERLDRLASRTLGDAEQSWRICDANVVIDPLTVDVRWPIRWRIPSN